MDEKKTLAQMAYEAYGGYTDWLNFQGNPMPKWEELPEKIKSAWTAASAAVFFECLNGHQSAYKE